MPRGNKGNKNDKNHNKKRKKPIATQSDPNHNHHHQPSQAQSSQAQSNAPQSEGGSVSSSLFEADVDDLYHQINHMTPLPIHSDQQMTNSQTNTTQFSGVVASGIGTGATSGANPGATTAPAKKTKKKAVKFTMTSLKGKIDMDEQIRFLKARSSFKEEVAWGEDYSERSETVDYEGIADWYDQLEGIHRRCFITGYDWDNFPARDVWYWDIDVDKMIEKSGWSQWRDVKREMKNYQNQQKLVRLATARLLVNNAANPTTPRPKRSKATPDVRGKQEASDDEMEDEDDDVVIMNNDPDPMNLSRIPKKKVNKNDCSLTNTKRNQHSQLPSQSASRQSRRSQHSNQSNHNNHNNGNGSTPNGRAQSRSRSRNSRSDQSLDFVKYIVIFSLSLSLSLPA